jgi:hypothetical protein
LQAPSIIDFEASGFGAASYPIEVGYVLGDGSRYCTLIRPVAGWTHWCRDAEAVHGVAREQLFALGRDPAEVCAQLDSALRGRTLYSDAWSYDHSWLHLLYDAAGRVPTFRLDSVRSLLDEDQVAAWHPTRDAVRREIDGARHRASVDALIVQVALCRIKRIAAPQLRDVVD